MLLCVLIVGEKIEIGISIDRKVVWGWSLAQNAIVFAEDCIGGRFRPETDFNLKLSPKRCEIFDQIQNKKNSNTNKLWTYQRNTVHL